ncbi:prenyltransferase/squalene oxidase repeat-containing protein [Streptomyces sp. NPDC059850]|uniref:prenyltransferase/squalene oxidase repeat-containing protein n=1 Tax=Streptomyces sp. NPDC059850 TaxID=3346970 RepID=UPI0036479847
MNARRSAAALAICAALCATAAPAASAAPSDGPEGLYGTKDPKFDGVWRQSLALLAQDATGVKPAKSAIDWLAGQQCADGGFAAYRADTGKACDPEKGEFTDATGAAIQALASVGGRSAAVEKGIGWLKKSQNEDGGWGMNPGGPSDANSTSVAVGALATAGMDPAEVAAAASGKTPYDALLGLQLDCSAKEAQRGAFAYTSGKGKPAAANDLATVSAALGTRGSGFVFEPVGKDDDKSPKPLACEGGKGGGADRTPEDASEAALAYLSTTMSGNGMHLKSTTPGAKAQPDFGATADAIMALAAGEHSAAAARPLQWLQGKDSGAVAWAKGDPGALAKLVLAAHAAGADPRHFGDADLVQQLNATGPKPVEEQASKSDAKGDDDGGGTGSVWWIVGSCAVAGMGIGFLLSGRKRQQL